MSGRTAEANSGGRGGRGAVTQGGRGGGQGRGKHQGPVPAPAGPTPPAGAWAGGTLDGFLGMGSPPSAQDHERTVAKLLAVMEELIKNETKNPDVLQVVMGTMVRAEGDASGLARKWQDAPGETAARIIALAMEAIELIDADGRYQAPGASGGPVYRPVEGGASGEAGAVAGAGEAAAGAGTAAPATAAAPAAPTASGAPAEGTALGAGAGNAFDGITLRCAPHQSGTPEVALCFFGGEQESSAPGNVPSPDKDNGSSGFMISGVMPGELMHLTRLQLMALSGKDKVFLYEFQQALSATIVDEFRNLCKQAGVEIKRAKEVEVGFAEDFYRTLVNPRQAGAGLRVITIEVPTLSQQLASLLARKPNVFSMELAGCTFVLGKEAVEIRRTPVRVEVDLTGRNRGVAKFGHGFLVAAGIATRPWEATKELGRGGHSSHMTFQVSQEALSFPDFRHSQTSPGQYKILPRNAWAQNGRGTQRFLRVPARFGSDEDYRSYYIPCWLTITEPGDQPQVHLAHHGERGDNDTRQEWLRIVEIEEEEESAQIAIQAALDEQEKEVRFAVQQQEEDERQKLSAAEREQQKQEQKRLQLAASARRMEERTDRLKATEAERKVRDAELAAVKLRKAEANRVAIEAAEEQRAAAEKLELEKAVADNAARAEEQKDLINEQKLRAMADLALSNQRRVSLLALARAFNAQKAALRLPATGGGRGGVDGADDEDGAASRTSLLGTQLDTPELDPGETPSAPPSPGGSKGSKRSERLRGMAPPAVAT